MTQTRVDTMTVSAVMPPWPPYYLPHCDMLTSRPAAACRAAGPAADGATVTARCGDDCDSDSYPGPSSGRRLAQWQVKWLGKAASVKCWFNLALRQPWMGLPAWVYYSDSSAESGCRHSVALAVPVWTSSWTAERWLEESQRRQRFTTASLNEFRLGPESIFSNFMIQNLTKALASAFFPGRSITLTGLGQDSNWLSFIGRLNWQEKRENGRVWNLKISKASELLLCSYGMKNQKKPMIGTKIPNHGTRLLNLMVSRFIQLIGHCLEKHEAVLVLFQRSWNLNWTMRLLSV